MAYGTQSGVAYRVFRTAVQLLIRALANRPRGRLARGALSLLTAEVLG